MQSTAYPKLGHARTQPLNAPNLRDQVPFGFAPPDRLFHSLGVEKQEIEELWLAHFSQPYDLATASCDSIW
jgi:hypothetical protein